MPKAKNPGGRPPKYTDPEVLESKINEYFQGCQRKPATTKGKNGEEVILTDKSGKPVFDQKIPTTAGLAHFLGYSDRQSLYDLKKHEKFSCSIKRAILAIEEYHEQRLGMGDRCTGSIFWMKNHGWKDRQEIDLTATVKEDTTFKIVEAPNGNSE